MGIKYKGNNQWKEVKVKVGDNIPVGAEFDYDGQTVPVGYEEVGGHNLVATTLWTNTTPTSDFTAQQITLNSADYDYLELWFYTSTGNAESFCFKTEKGKRLRVFYFIGEDAGGYFGFRFRFINYVDDTTLSIGDCNQKKVNEQTVQLGNDWAIPYKVIGYKEV